MSKEINVIDLLEQMGTIGGDEAITEMEVSPYLFNAILMELRKSGAAVPEYTSPVKLVMSFGYLNIKRNPGSVWM